MREYEIIEQLQKEIVVPGIVQMKADDAFEQIRQERCQRKRSYGKKAGWKAVRVAAAAAVLTSTTVTVCAAVYMHWSRGLEAQLKPTDEQKIQLEEQQAAAPIKESAVDAGITITAEQSIVDKNFAHLSFKVEGYELPDGAEPAFETIDVTAGGSSDFSWNGSFFNGIVSDNNGNPVFVDGTPLGDDWQEVFVAEDGSMEFDLTLYAGEVEGRFINAPVHIRFQNLGTVQKAEYSADLTGTWEMDFMLKGSDQIRQFTMSKELGDTACSVIEAEISPISIHARYRMPVETEEIPAVDEFGNQTTSTVYKEPPALAGVRLKDGTMLPYLMNGGSEGFEDIEAGIYQVTFALDRILDTDQVDALLFRKEVMSSTENLSAEENFYIVPLK